MLAFIAVAEAVTQIAQRAYAPEPTPQQVVLSAATGSPANTPTPAPSPVPSVTPSPTLEASGTPTLAPPTPRPTQTFTPKPPPPLAPFVRADSKLYLGERLLLDVAAEAPQCTRVGEMSISPTSQHFVAVLECPGWEDQAFLFSADGEEKRAITGAWDFVAAFHYQWSSDGHSLIYERINSCCAAPSEIPLDAPLPGLVRYDLRTGEKALISKFRVVHVRADDVLNVRTDPGIAAQKIGGLPPGATDIVVTGEPVGVGDARWVPIAYGQLKGWVNLNYLERQQFP